jgi:membrane-associated protease RseP (regulator of RpoE activity)
MIELGLTKELLELGGPNLVPFLQSANNYETTQVQHSLQVLFLYSLLLNFFNIIPIEL